MAKEELLEFDGTVVEALPDARFRIALDVGHQIIAYTAGKMKKEPDQDLGRRSGDHRNVPLQSGEGATDLSTQG
jgi:hypothetical protein